MIEKIISEEVKALERSEMLEILADSLKKQVPMTVTKKHDKGLTLIGGEIAVCPGCGSIIFIVFSESKNYCSCCGQKLRWEE